MKYHVNLSDRNKMVADKVTDKLEYDRYCAIVSAPGTGKSYVSLELICRNMGKNMLFLAPTNAILNQYKTTIASEGLLGDVDIYDMEEIDRRLKIYFPNLELHTYQWFHINQTNGNLDNVDYDYIICDEYHHTGSNKWYLSFNDYANTHKHTKFLGMSATPHRMDGQNTLFSFDNDVVYEYSMADAIVNGELSMPIYIDCGIRYLGEILKARKTILEEYLPGKERDDLLRDIELFLRDINSYDKLPEIFSKYIEKNAKVLYFCPPSNSYDRLNNTKRIYEIYNLREKMFSDVNRDAHYYMSFSDYKNSEDEEEAFISDFSDVLRVLYTVNKYSEGVHQEDINVLIMGRGTSSVPLFTQMLGRILLAGKKLNIRPIVLDLQGNIHIYQELVEEVRKTAIAKVQRGERLPNNQTINQFMRKFEIYDYELEQKEFLDMLNDKIRDNRDSKRVLTWVHELEEYCELYKGWPKPNDIQHKVSDGTTSSQLYSWLYTSGYSDGEFKHKNIVDENGNLVIDILNELFSKYGRVSRRSDENILLWASRIKEYCELYKDWPKYVDYEHKVSDGTISRQLYAWLNSSGYNNGKFKYVDVVDEDGVKVIDIINDLFSKYGRISKKSDKYVILMVKNIEEYCELYGEWPRQGDVEHKISDGTTSVQLAAWLNSSGYNKENFKYIDIVDEDGIKVIDILNNLFIKYGRVSQRSDKYVILMVKNIEEYCELYGEWPRQRDVEHKIGDGTTSAQLATWLNTSGYNNGKFKYVDVIDEDGVKVIDILNNLFSKYGRVSQRSDKHVILMVKNIEEYCKLYGEWPKSHNKKCKVGDEMTSRQLTNWLYTSRYNSDKFKYEDIVDENGIKVIDILNNLFSKYGRVSQKRDKRIILMVKNIEEYCELYGEWPKQRDYEHKVSDGTTSQQLYSWLMTSGYNSGKFKHKDMVDENGNLVIEILDKLNVIYNTSVRSINKMEDNDKLLNLKNAEKSKEIGLNLYYMIVKLMDSYYDNNRDEFNNYCRLIEDMIESNDIYISLDDIVSSFDLSSSELRYYYYKKYTISSIWNDNVLAELYKCLYNYMDMINKTRGKNK